MSTAQGKTELIHNFGTKLTQQSVSPNLIDYIRWRIDKEKGQNEVSAPEFAPISINLDLTTSCNYYCDHCIDLDVLNTGDRFSIDEVKGLIDQFKARGLKSVILIGGGEPTVSPGFEEGVAYIKESGLQVGIVTNGSRMFRIQNICHLLEPGDYVRLSLDAGTDETFQEQHRVKAKGVRLEDICASIPRIKAINDSFEIGYSYLVMWDGLETNGRKLLDNIGEISLTAQAAKKHQFDYLSLKPVIDPRPERDTKNDRAALERYKAAVIRARTFEDESFRVVESINMISLVHDLDEELKKQPQVCHAQFFRIVVTPIGIYHCPVYRGAPKAFLSDMKGKTPEEHLPIFQDARVKMVDSFNAAKECAEVTCIYNSMNWWIDDMIQSPEKLSELEKTADLNDYYL